MPDLNADVNWNMCDWVKISFRVAPEPLLILDNDNALAHVVETNRRICSGRTTTDHTDIASYDVLGGKVLCLSILGRMGDGSDDVEPDQADAEELRHIPPR